MQDLSEFTVFLGQRAQLIHSSFLSLENSPSRSPHTPVARRGTSGMGDSSFFPLSPSFLRPFPPENYKYFFSLSRFHPHRLCAVKISFFRFLSLYSRFWAKFQKCIFPCEYWMIVLSCAQRRRPCLKYSLGFVASRGNEGGFF